MIFYSLKSSLLFFVLIVVFYLINTSDLATADENNNNQTETQVKQDKNLILEKVKEDTTPDKIPIDFTKLNSTLRLQPRIPSCKQIYVYQEGCPYAYKLYDQGGVYNSQMGSYEGIYNFHIYDNEGYGIFKISVAQIGTPNQLYFVRDNKKYWLQFYSSSTLSSTRTTSKASWFHLTPRKPMQISISRSGYRYYYTFYSDSSSCVDSFLIGHSFSFTGRRILVYSC